MSSKPSAKGARWNSWLWIRLFQQRDLSESTNPHPIQNAARLFIDFVLSKEGQELIVKTDRSSVRKDVTGNPLDLIKNVRVVPSDLSLGKDYIRLRDEYRQFLGINQ